MINFIKKYWQIGLVIVMVLFLFYKGCTGDVHEHEVPSTKEFVDSLKNANAVLTGQIVEKDKVIEGLLKKDSVMQQVHVADVKAYNKLSRSKRVVEFVKVYGEVQKTDTTICLDDRQMDSVNVVGKERDYYKRRFEGCQSIVGEYQEIRNLNESKIYNLSCGLDTTEHERDELRVDNEKKDVKIKELEASKKNRGKWIKGLGIFAAAQTAWIYIRGTSLK